MAYCEDWGLPIARVEDFFLSQLDVDKVGDHRFLFGDCEIILTALPDRRMGSLLFPRTLVEFRGEPESTEMIHRRFTLRFLSAGG